MILCFVSTLEKHLQSNQYQDPFYEIRHVRTKYVYFLFRLHYDFGSFTEPWRNRLCIWTISQERGDLDCNSEAVSLLNSPLLKRSDYLSNNKGRQSKFHFKWMSLVRVLVKSIESSLLNVQSNKISIDLKMLHAAFTIISVILRPQVILIMRNYNTPLYDNLL